MRAKDKAASAVTLQGRMTEQDRAIVARRDAGETMQAIATALGIPVSQVHRAEWRRDRDAEGRAYLAERPDSIAGLSWIGELDANAADRLRFHHYHHECHELKGLSDVAALGRAYVSRIQGIGPKSLASIDRALGLFGIAWSPIDRTPKPKPEEATQTGGSQYWSEIVRQVCSLEQATGRGILQSHPYRDSQEGIAVRLAYLTGYIETAERYHGKMIDVTPGQDGGDLERSGNLVCLPGVKLIDVLQNDGGQS